MQLNPFQGETWNWVFLPAASALSQVCSNGSVPVLLNNCFCSPIFCSPVGLMNTSPTGYHSWVIWGPIPQVASLKVGVLDVWSVVQMVHSQGEAGSWGAPSQVCGAMPGVGFMAAVCLSLSHLFWYGHFLCWLMYRSHSSSYWISLRGNYSMCSVYSVSPWEERNSGGSCVAILVQKPLQIWFLKEY